MEKLGLKKKQEIVDHETEKVSLKEKVEKFPEVLVSCGNGSGSGNTQ